MLRFGELLLGQKELEEATFDCGFLRESRDPCSVMRGGQCRRQCLRLDHLLDARVRSLCRGTSQRLDFVCAAIASMVEIGQRDLAGGFVTSQKRVILPIHFGGGEVELALGFARA